MKKYFLLIIASMSVLLFSSAKLTTSDPENDKASTAGQLDKRYKVPPEYLKERANIPAWWVSSYDDVTAFLLKNVHKGKVEIIGTTAGGRPIRAVFYGKPREGRGTTTFSGSLGFGDSRVYRGPDHGLKVYMAMAAVHGGEFEGIVGMVNLISVLETGKDLKGREWPAINEWFAKLDRVILIPIVNADGRVRIPLRMEVFTGTSITVAEYLNTGGKPDGTITGWPQIKEFIPMKMDGPSFPGGYPNDPGVNIQHDDFFGKKQPETQALFDLTAREKPDLILNLHTGAVYMRMDRPVCEPALHDTFDTLFKYVHSELGAKGLQFDKDPQKAGDPANASTGVFNIDGALNFNCGALSVVVESPSHSFDGLNEEGKPAAQTPDMLLDAQLTLHQQAMKFLAITGGRSKWLPGRNK
jgi:hypothetical protein